jgi:hypothetical protein
MLQADDPNIDVGLQLYQRFSLLAAGDASSAAAETSASQVGGHMMALDVSIVS